MCWKTGTRRDIHFYWGARHTQDLYEEELVLEWVRPAIRTYVTLRMCPSVRSEKPRIIRLRLGA